MSIFSDIYTDLNVTTVTDVVDDISPYVRARGSSFPAVIIEVPTQNFERLSSGVYRTASSVTLTCLARSVLEAEAVSEAVLAAATDNVCNVIESIDRDYEEGYDDDSVGTFIVTINYTNYKGV